MFSRSGNVSVVKLLYFNKFLFSFKFSKFDYLSKKYMPCSTYPLQIHRFFITSNHVQVLHTTKGWKSIARDGHKEEFNPEKPFHSCEEGTDALPHDVLMSQLQNCNTISEQIKTFCSSISLTSEDVENRKELCKSLTETFRPYFPEFKLHLFGSSMNGLGFKGCDADLSIQTTFAGEDYVKGLKQVPTIDAIIKGEVSADTVARLPPPYMLRLIRRILRSHCTDVPEPIMFIKARCPLLRFYNAKYDVFCDFTCENYTSLRNTKLIRFLCQLDERFSALAKIIRYWGKYGAFVGDIDLFNSYSFSLLVVHFLQLRNPPVLPPINEIIEKSEYVTNADLSDDEQFFNDLKKFSPSQNSQTVEELLREYFFHYLTFDYLQMMIPASSSYMSKDEFVPTKTEGSETFEFSHVTVQDPFRLNFNTTAAAKFKACKRFMNGVVEACKAYQDENIWHPSANNWGLCSLFQRTIYEHEMFRNCKTHTIKLPLKTDITLVSKIFQEGLLFDCRELLTENNTTSQPSLRLNCNVYYNTWVGRGCIYANHPKSLTNQLEIENWVSNQILKNKGSTKQLQCTFLCECFENSNDNELNVVLTFKDSKSSLVAIFLKEYIPSMYKKLSCKN